uniref:Uncharacterized protein n=1 Tax=Glossina austeni TaxID=7395 RepID=A0A1A9V7I9_GLOAU
MSSGNTPDLTGYSTSNNPITDDTGNEQQSKAISQVDKIPHLKVEVKLIPACQPKVRQVSEIGNIRKKDDAVETYETRNTKPNNSHRSNLASQNKGHKVSQESQNAGNTKSTQTVANTPIEMPTRHLLPARFDLFLRFPCGMPSDFFFKPLLEAPEKSRCKCIFHDVLCFAYGKNESHCHSGGMEENPNFRQAVSHPGK